MSDDDIERLSAGYRATVEDPPHDAIDATVLRAAARRARAHALPLPRVVYAVAAGLLVALGVAAGLRVNRQTPAHKEAQAFNRQAGPVDDYLTSATLTSPQGVLQRSDPEVLLRTFAPAQPSEPTCGAAAAVDLNAPGALDGLKAARPGDYSRITGIVAGITRHPEPDVARWISTTFHAVDVSYVPLWLTSLPPKRRLSFCLRGTRYDVVLTITHDGARVSYTQYPGKPRSHAAAPP